MIRAGFEWGVCDVYGWPDETSREAAEDDLEKRLRRVDDVTLARWGAHLAQGVFRDVDAEEERAIERLVASVLRDAMRAWHRLDDATSMSLTATRVTP